MKLCQNLYNEFEEYVTPSEIIEFMYCQRFTYYMKSLTIPQNEGNRFKVQIGREKHNQRAKQNKDYVRKRIGGVSKWQEVYLISKKYSLKGIVDEIYLLDDGTYAPLDYKFAEYKEKDFETYKTQMILYSLIIEDIYKIKVNRFFLVYIRSKNLIKEVQIADKEKEQALNAVNNYKKVLKGFYPKATKYKARCIDCCYAKICYK